MLNYIVTGNSITILIDNRPEIIDNTHPNFEKVEFALKQGWNEKQILELMNVGKAVVNFGEGKVQVKDGEITYNGKVVHSSLSTRILSLMENGFDISPFVKFMENLYNNPSKSAVDGLYGFLEACNLPITEDGCFLAYKKINHNYTDCYTGTLDNSIGATVSMPRYEVNEDSNQTCSSGLHVASYSYMAHYSGDRIVICKVHPKDVVAVPNDYDNAKMRVCQYEVINEVNTTGEEITPNVIKDDEAYSKEYTEKEDIPEIEPVNGVPVYDGCQDMLDDVGYGDKASLLSDFRNIPEAYEYLSAINGSTSFWKRNLIDILHTYYKFDDCPEEEDTWDIPYSLDEIKKDRIKSYISLFGKPDLDLTTVANVDLRLAVENKTRLPNENKTFYSKPKSEKMKFSKRLSDYLVTFETEKWNKLSAYLLSKDVNIMGLLRTALKLQDEQVIINKIKSLTKEGKLKKKDIIKDLEI